MEIVESQRISQEKEQYLERSQGSEQPKSKKMEVLQVKGPTSEAGGKADQGNSLPNDFQETLGENWDSQVAGTVFIQKLSVRENIAIMNLLCSPSHLPYC